MEESPNGSKGEHSTAEWEVTRFILDWCVVDVGMGDGVRRMVVVVVVVNIGGERLWLVDVCTMI